MIFSILDTIAQSGLNLLNLPFIQYGSPLRGVAVGFNEAGEPIDTEGNRVSVITQKYVKPEPAPTPAPVVTQTFVSTPATIKKKEILAMPQPAMAGSRPMFIGGQVPPNIFQQTPVSPRVMWTPWSPRR